MKKINTLVLTGILLLSLTSCRDEDKKAEETNSSATTTTDTATTAPDTTATTDPALNTKKMDQKQDEKTGTSAKAGDKPHDLARKQNEQDKNDKDVPAGVKDKYIRDRKIVGNKPGDTTQMDKTSSASPSPANK